MKISTNTVNYLKDNGLKEKHRLTPTELSDKIGSQLGAIESVIDIGKKYADVLIVKVVSSEKHPNADKLHVCLIDDGKVVKDVPRNEQGLVTVVCGAPNVRAGLSVAWLPPGSTVPETAYKEPFVLTARELRGVISNGMIASPKELAMGDNHEGILEIDGDHAPGTSFAETYGLKDEFIIDIENKMFTHRPDCFGWIGVAREVAGITHSPYKSLDWYKLKPELPEVFKDQLPLKVINELPDLVPRFCALTMSGIEVKPSPVWLQIELVKVGLRPINNIVDLTNFMMVMTSQPLHAYDYDKVKALSGANEPVIKIRRPIKTEKLKLLNGKEIEPGQEAIIIATERQAIGLGGIMGGSDTEVDDSTKNIILECANFNMYSIRRTSMEHGLFSDAATRFTKGQSPLQNPCVIVKAMADLKDLANGTIASQLIDDNHISQEVLSRGSMHPSVKTSAEFINSRLGLNLTDDDIKELLTNVEFKVDSQDGSLIFSAPFWRTDIEIPEDIVEEVGRLYGYDRLELSLPKRDLTPAIKDSLLSAKASIRKCLSSMGANEVLTYSFVHADLLAKVAQDKTKAYEVGNALRPELQYYRLSLMPSLLEKVHPNIKAGFGSFALFEIAKVHDVDSVDDGGLPKEYEYTGLVIAKDDKLKDDTSPYYLAKQYLSLLCEAELEFKPLSDSALNFPVAKPYEPKRSSMVYIKATNEFLGLVGEFNMSTKRALKLPRYCAGFEVDTALFNKVMGTSSYVPLSRFPKVTQDISLKVASNVSFASVLDVVKAATLKAKPKNTIFDLEPKDIYQNEDKDHKNITLRLNIASYDRTFTDSEVNSLLDQVAAEAKSSFQAERL